MAELPEQTEYKFHIDAFTPQTIPLERLAEYLSYIARIIGEKESVHLDRVEGGSTTPVLRIDREAIPKVRERIHLVRAGEGPADAKNALGELNKRLAQDNANGVLLDATDAKVLKFPGIDAATHIEYGPLTEPGVFEGVPIKVGGERKDVPVHLQDGDRVHIIYAPRRIAMEIGHHLFVSSLRVEGQGKWMRDRFGDWVMQKFIAERVEVLKQDDLATSLARLRAIPAEWKALEDPLATVAQIRNGEVSA